MYRIRINPLAQKDLIDIKEYIANELDNPSSAAKIILKVVESYERLKEFPMLGASLSSEMDIVTDYRYLIVGKYIIFYKVGDIFVSIYRIFYAKRDYLNILFSEDERER